MILNKIFNHNKDDNFYLLFAKVFCSKQIDKEIGSKVYDDNYFWYNITDSNGDLLSFISFEKKDNKINIKDMYTFEKHRNKGLADKLLKEILRDYFDYNFFVICNSNSENIFIRNGFNIVKEFKNWKHLVK